MKYTVISPSPDQLEATRKVMSKLPYKNYYIIEFGKNGTHEHYNIIWLETDKRTDKYKEILLKLFEPKLTDVSRYFIVTRHIKDLAGLLGYVTKEPNYEIVGDMPPSHEELLKRVLDKPERPANKFTIHPSSSEFALLIQSFVLKYYANENHVALESVIRLMIRKGVNLVNLLPKIKYHAFVAHELLLSQNNIVLNMNEINFLTL